MKVYAVTKHCYDYCNEWTGVDSYFLDENKALDRQLQLELEYEEGCKDENREWISIQTINIQE